MRGGDRVKGCNKVRDCGRLSSDGMREGLESQTSLNIQVKREVLEVSIAEWWDRRWRGIWNRNSSSEKRMPLNGATRILM